MINNKTSILVPFQLPEYIRDNPDYSKFVLFLQAYYEWMEQQGHVLDATKNLLNYADIDNTTDDFLNYFINDFIPNFPEDALVDKSTAVKISKLLYSTKGTPASYKLLFKILYNSDFDVFNTKDAVLKASSGLWYVPKSLNLDTSDTRFLNTTNYRIVGETTKSVATIENCVLNGSKIQIFISNIERQFESGETIRVVDANNQDVIVSGSNLRAKIVGQISQITISKDQYGNAIRGLFYQSGDPVIVYGGLRSITANDAVAQVGTITSGSVQRINVLTGGYAYTPLPNTVITFGNLNDGAVSPYATVASVDTSTPGANSITNFIAINSIRPSVNTKLSTVFSFFANNTSAVVTTKLSSAFSFTSFHTWPISSVIVQTSGSGINTAPLVIADSQYQTDYSPSPGHLVNLGILAPIQISSNGVGYQLNDQIVFTGGSGYGAYANVTSVNANGAIQQISYVQRNNFYPLGGMGYRIGDVPTVTINSANVSAYGANVYVPGILGAGATFNTSVDRTGAITTINVLNSGQDYVATPNVSLRIQDILVSNVTISLLPKKLDKLTQTSNGVVTYTATVNSISLIQSSIPETSSLYSLRVFDYNSQPNPTLPITVTNKNINMNMANTDNGLPRFNQYGVLNYGDGNAQATATFLNGLVISSGRYLNSQGQVSGFDVLQSQNYNNYTYQITVEKEIAKYRSVLLNLLHPSGLKLIGRYAMKSNTDFDYLSSNTEATKGYPLYHYTGNPGVTASIQTTFTNKSNNIVTFNGTSANIANFIYVDSPTSNSFIELIGPTTNVPNVRSEVIAVDYINSQITLKDNVWLTFANVATVTANSGSSVINISTLTGAYNLINNGNYTDPNYPLKDIVFVGDSVLIDNNTSRVVTSIDYVNGQITVDTPFTSGSNSYLAVKRYYSTNLVEIYGPAGTIDIPQLTDSSGNYIITEDSLYTIILG